MEIYHPRVGAQVCHAAAVVYIDAVVQTRHHHHRLHAWALRLDFTKPNNVTHVGCPLCMIQPRYTECLIMLHNIIIAIVC